MIGHTCLYSTEQVSSLGRVRADRSIEYKYLNPHLFAVVTQGDETMAKDKCELRKKKESIYECLRERREGGGKGGSAAEKRSFYVPMFSVREKG